MVDVDLWLDDMRPAPIGWIHVRTDAEARAYLKRRVVRNASLDHDLGACKECKGDDSDEAWLARTGYQSMPHCEHFGTGYTLVCWMEMVARVRNEVGDPTTARPAEVR